MKNGIEIRWHGRGGQGAKTAALLLADVAFKTGKHVQGFPEYGPERMGAPITAYNRISSDVIRVHSNIYDPDYVAVVDETLLHTVDVTAGLKKEGAIIVNTAKSKEEIMTAIQCATRKQRYICNHVSNLLLSGASSPLAASSVDDHLLTQTEKNILKEIALGKTTKEITAEKNLSFHTINSHRKNIFRKLGVNNVHEATKYAMRAGIVDLAEYYI